MNRCLNLFLKDAQRLWPQVLVYFVVLSIRLSNDPLYVIPNRATYVNTLRAGILGALAYLALWVLVVELIHQENLIGDRQYWLTRPFVWHDLLLGKTLFALAFILLPLFIGHTAVLIWLGFPVFTELPALLMKGLVFAAALVLPAAALACVTRNVTQMAVTAIVGYIFARIAAEIYQWLGFRINWGELDWIRVSMGLAILTLGAILVMSIQYALRRTGLSRTLFAVALAAAFAVMLLPAGSWAFSIQALLSRRKIDNSAVQFVPDPARNKSSFGINWGSNDPHGAIIRIPVHIEGLQPNMGAQGVAAQFTVGAAGAGEWRLDWRVFQDVLQGTLAQPFLALAIDPAFYDRVKDKPVRIAGFIDMTLFTRDQVRVREGGYTPGAGVCITRIDLNSFNPLKIAFDFLDPWPRAHLELDVDSKLIGSFISSDECAPWPTSPSFAPVVGRSDFSIPLPMVVASSPPIRVLVRPVAHIRRHFDFHDLRPRDYFVEKK